MAEIRGTAKDVEEAKERSLQAYYACQVEQLRLKKRILE
jgi:hypothetical protein